MKQVRIVVVSLIISLLLLYAITRQRVLVEIDAHTLKENFVSLYFDAPDDAMEHRAARGQGAPGVESWREEHKRTRVTDASNSAQTLLPPAATPRAVRQSTQAAQPAASPPPASTPPPASLPPPSPRAARYPVRSFCSGVTAAHACKQWYEQRDRAPAPRALGMAAVACAADCHGRGVCDKSTGICACEAGYNGTACETLNVRKCNDQSDGMWVASHCAGECDEKRGWCWCPGQVGSRPMVETCQVKHMPLESFAALLLKPDPQARKYHPATGEEIDSMGPGRVPSRDSARQRQFRSLQAELISDPTRRAEVARTFWYGPARIGPDGHDVRPRVAINANGVPRTVNASQQLPPLSPSEEAWNRQQATLSKPEEGWYQKLAARGTHKYSELLVSSTASTYQKLLASSKPDSKAAADPAPAWCEAKIGGRSAAHSCPCVYDGMHGELCEGRHEPFCPNQCSGHGVCSEFGGMCTCGGSEPTT